MLAMSKGNCITSRPADLRQLPDMGSASERNKGNPHHTAVRALAFKWQRIIWRCWQDRQPYEEQKYEAALRHRGSELVKLFDRVELGKSPFKNPAKTKAEPRRPICPTANANSLRQSAAAPANC